MIPKSFFLYGQRICVTVREDLVNAEGAVGTSRHHENVIHLQGNKGSWQRKEDQIEQTFYHELVHTILHQMHRNNLNDDEDFVDTFAQLLHQALITAEYDDAEVIRTLSSRECAESD